MGKLEQGALITRRDFEILKEGAGVNEHASRRDVCLALLAGSAAGITACLLVAESITEWWIGSVMFFGIVAGVSAILAGVFHKMRKSALGRQSYRDTCAAIELALPPRVRVDTGAPVRVGVAPADAAPASDVQAEDEEPDGAEPKGARRTGGD